MLDSLLEEVVEALTPHELETKLAEDCFAEFVKQAWPILEPATPYKHNWHIDAMCDHLQAVSNRHILNLIINVPPGSAKSLIASVFWQPWHWLKQPNDRFLTGSHADALSIRDAVKSRRLIESIWYQSRWADRFQLTGDQNEKKRWENDKTGFRIATHVGGATGERAQFLTLDDPHEIEDAESDTIRESTIEWVRSTWSERIADAKNSGRVVIMQRLHERDTSGFLLNEEGGFEHLMIPMEFEPSRKFFTSVWPHGDPRTVEGELLFPERWDADEVMRKKRRLGSYKAAGQLQQRPAPDEGGILKRHWWRYWHYPNHPLPPVVVKTKEGHETIPCVELPYHFDQYAQSWDMAFKGEASNDFVVGGQWAKLGVDAYCLDLVRDQQDFVGTMRMVKAFNERWDVPGPKLVEDKANGPAIVSSLKNEIPGIVMYPVLGGDKIARARAYAPYAEAGHCVLPHPSIAPWVPGFIEELATFPNATHDDQCFAAGTMIATPWGDRAIETIQPGDHVLTPFGIRRVLHAGMTGFSHVIERHGLVATPRHKIYVTEGLFIPFESVDQAGQLNRLSNQELKAWTYRRLCTSTDGNSGLAGRDAIISAGQQPMLGGSVLKGCMSQCGKLIMDGQFLRVMRFIIRTATRLTTTQAIWSVYRTSNMLRSLTPSGIWRNSWHTLIGLGRSRRPGMEARKENGFTASSHGRIGSTSGRRFIGVRIADTILSLVNGTRPCIVRQSVAITPAAPLVCTASNGNVSYAKPDSPRISLSIPLASAPPVAEAAPQKLDLSSKVPVYNLEVEHDHVYYANGVLVSNCDMWSQVMSKLYAPEADIVPITPEYHPQFHLLPSPREATKGALVTSFRFWMDGLHPTCILGQVTPDRQRILVLDCVQMDNASLEELIDRKVMPVLKAHYQGVGQWRDIGNYRALHAKSSAIEHRMATLISEKLQGMLEPGEADFFQRVTAIKTVLGQTGRMLVNPRPSIGESKMLVHEALSGGYAYKTDAKTNAVSQAEARPFHPLTAVGEALGHGLARVFVRRPIPDPEERTPMSERQKRASGYAVGGRKR